MFPRITHLFFPIFALWSTTTTTTTSSSTTVDAAFLSNHKSQRRLSPPSTAASSRHQQLQRRPFFVSSLQAASTRVTAPGSVDARRRELLSRKGPYFSLNRQTGQIEFGATARLVTQLNVDHDDDKNNNQYSKNGDKADYDELIASWLRDEDSFAMSIWREDLIQRRHGDDPHVYRFQLMTLQFVTLRLAPWVDLRMKSVNDRNGRPVFTLQSINFDPNVEILPGMKVSAEQLGIVIEVAGQLRALPTTSNPAATSVDGAGAGVTGSIAFSTTGYLPAPLLLLPDVALQAACDAINETVVNFAVQSFQKGARENFAKYVQKQHSKKQQQQQKQHNNKVAV